MSFILLRTQCDARSSFTRSPRPLVHSSARHCSNRIVSSCHAKCIQPDPMKGRYAEPELLKGEAVCIDRCTMKFFEVNDKVSQRMQAMGGQAQMAGSFGR